MTRNFYTVYLLIFFLLLIHSKDALAQDYGTLRGYVTDSLTTEALPFTSAVVKELSIGATTDIRGYFIIPSIPANKKFTLMVSYVGYYTKTISIMVTKGKVTQYNIPLVNSNIQMQTIEQVGTRINDRSDTKISLQRISAHDLEAMPKGVETDVFRSIKYLPGVQSTGDVSARYYVRGGASNQNLVLIDGITVYNPFHALGLFGVIDPDLINSIEFFKGGFSAEYGGRLSSVMRIITKDGNKNSLSGKATMSLMTAKLLLEGPIPNGSFIVTGRKSYSNDILKKFFNDKTVPADFYDFSFKANYSNPDFIEGARFSANGFFSSDNITNKDPRIEDYKWSNNIFGFKWFQVGDSPLFLELGLSASQFKGNVDPKLSDVTPMENTVKDIGLDMNFTYMFDNRDEIGVGFNVKQVSTIVEMQNANGISSLLNNSAANITFYLKYKLMQLSFLGLDVGTRFNLTTLSKNSGAQVTEPRANINLKIMPELSIKGSIGLFQQELITISDENEVINIFEPWIISPEYLAPARAVHYIVGMESEFVKGFTFNVEGYYKKVINLALLNDKKILSSDRDFISGEGESYGLEVFTRINPDPINFTASYTHAFAYKMVDGKRYYPRYDIRNSINLSLEVDLGNDWSTSAVWTYNSSLPFTQIMGYYDKFYFQNFYTNWDKYDPRMPYSILAIQNLGRLPEYHRLDFTLSKKLKLDIMNVYLDFSIINVYDRKNIFYFKRDTGERVNMLPFLPSATIKVEL